MTYEQQAELIQKQEKLIGQLQMENKLLRQKVDLLIRRVFGSSSEKLDVNQLNLLLEGLEAAPPKPEPCDESPERSRRERKRSPRREMNLEHLPVVVETVDPLEVQAAPQQWKQISQEVTESLEYEPSRMWRRQIIRRRFVKKDEPMRVPVIAPLPPRLLEGSPLSPSLLAHVIVEKFCYHMPLYRQEAKFLNEHGIVMNRQSLCRWLGVGVFWLELIYERMRREVWTGDYTQLDETPVEYLCPGHGSAKTGYLWTSNRPRGETLYQWFPSRGSECLKDIIPESFGGTIQTDGYSAYASYGQRHPDITWAGCWAHVRRGFFEAKEEDPRRAGWVLGQLRQLYRTEAQLRRQGPGSALRVATRQASSAAVIDRLEKMMRLWENQKRFLPKSGMGKAIAYTLRRMNSLRVFLTVGSIEIDNNLVENAIRPTAVGKKNWLFFGNELAGQKAAVLYTIIESCRRHGIDPESYLRHVLTVLPAATTSQIKDLTPAAIARSGIVARFGKRGGAVPKAA